MQPVTTHGESFEYFAALGTGAWLLRLNVNYIIGITVNVIKYMYMYKVYTHHGNETKTDST